MKDQTKKDIIKILLTIYNVPGQYTIVAIILLAFWNAMKKTTPLSILFLIFAIIFIILEILSPIIAGKRLYDKAIKNFRKLFKQIFFKEKRNQS